MNTRLNVFLESNTRRVLLMDSWKKRSRRGYCHCPVDGVVCVYETAAILAVCTVALQYCGTQFQWFFWSCKSAKPHEIHEGCCKHGAARIRGGLLLLQDKARPHTATATLFTIQRLRILQHPPYSTALVLLPDDDYRVFGPVKSCVWSDGEVKEAPRSGLKTQPERDLAAVWEVYLKGGGLCRKTTCHFFR